MQSEIRPDSPLANEFVVWCRREGCMYPGFASFGYWINHIADDEAREIVSEAGGAAFYFQRHVLEGGTFMIISRSHANRLVRQGKATLDGSTYHNGQRYQIVIRHDCQRVDHFALKPGQSTRIQVKVK